MRLAGPALERVLVPMLFRGQIYRVARRLRPSRIAIVMYHGFTALDRHDGLENHEGKHVHARDFTAHLEFLKTHHTVLPLEDIVDALRHGRTLPPRPAAITIDDGYRSIYTVAYPILRRLQLPAAVFLATEFVDGRRCLWTDRVEFAVSRSRRETLEVTIGGRPERLPIATADERMSADRRLRSLLKQLPQDQRDTAVAGVERAAGTSVEEGGAPAALYAPLEWNETAEMAASGLVTFGSHTHTHVILSRCTRERALDELRMSKRIIEDRLGRPCRTFCYPNGRTGDFNEMTTALLREEGFSCGLTTVYGTNARQADVYRLKRYNLGKPLMTGELEVRMSGLMDLGSLTHRRPARTPHY